MVREKEKRLAGYVNRVRGEISRWQQSGLIDATTASRLSEDIGANAGRSISFGNVLATMAAVLLGASLLLFIGSNWEEFPRAIRVLSLFALILATYVGGAIVKQRGHAGIGEALYLVGAAAFGGSIALIGQMYHLSGDESAAVLTWCFGTIFAAVGLRSPILTNAAVLLATGWFLMRGFDWSGRFSLPHAFLLILAAIWVVSYWTRSTAARHLILLAVILYALLLGIQTSLTPVGAGLAIVSVIVFLVAHFAPEETERFAQLGGPYPVLPVIGFLTGISMIQVDVIEQFGPMLLTTLVAFAGIVAALLMRGKQSALMRWVAYAAFTIELVFLYLVTLGTMIDTAGLFLFSGVALAAIAFFILRFERRFKGEPA